MAPVYIFRGNFLSDWGFRSKPNFIDIDGDGDLDILSGQVTYDIRFFENNGDGTFTRINGANNPFESLDAVLAANPRYRYNEAAIADIDGDGKFEVLFVAPGDPVLFAKEGSNGNFTQQTGANNPFDGVNLGSGGGGRGGGVTFVDLDEDGDLDLVMGEPDGTFRFFTNNGSGNFTEQFGANNPLDGIDVGSDASSAFNDIDGDGDLDAFFGRGDGTLDFYENDGSNNFTLNAADNPFTLDVGIYSQPSFGDYDGDGDEDFFVGEQSPEINFYEAIAQRSPVAVDQTLIPIPGVTVTVNMPANGSPSRIIDGSGLSMPSEFGTSTHSSSFSDMWYSQQAFPAPLPQVFTFDLGGLYSLDQMAIWNYNALLGGTYRVESGTQTFSLEYSSDGGTSYQTLLGDTTLNRGGTTDEVAQIYNLPSVSADFVRMTVSANYGGSLTGLSEVQFGVSNEAPIQTLNLIPTGDEDTVIDLSGISINDADGNLVSTQLTVTSNTLTVDLAGGATISAGANNSTAFTLSGTQAQINAALDTLGYVGATDFFGSDTLTVVSTDSFGETDTDTVTITVNSVNDLPVAAADTASTDEDTAVTTGNVLTNDNDPEGDTLSITSIDITGTLGTVTNNGDGTFTYDPNGQFEALNVGDTATDSFTYTVSDGNGGTDTATVTITIDGAFDNIPPQITFGSQPGSSLQQSASFELSSLDGSSGFALNGIAGGDQLGSSVSNAGDVNSDGIDDIIIGASRADANGSDSGQSYVVFGNSSGVSPSLELSALDGTNGFVLDGIVAGDQLGSSVSSAGDVNGDGIDDIIITAPGADANGSFAAGQSYVVFGSSNGFSPNLDLASLDGTNGFAITGITGSSGVGSVSTAGDVNGDGFDDLILGAVGAVSSGMITGQSYVVFGASGGFSPNLALSSLNGANGFTLNGIAMYDDSGRSVSSAGDVNGDGFDDIIIGASGADPNGSNSGQSYVVFGKSNGFSANLALSSLNGTNGFILNGVADGDRAGRSVSGAGDVNGDGIDDFIIGASTADPNGSFSGQSYVVFGSGSGFGASLELSSLDGTNGFALNGIAASDQSGLSVSTAGDINGDNLDDIIIGAFRANPNGNDSGQSYVVFGSSNGFSASLNLSSLDGTNGFALNGIAASDQSGVSVSTAGDVNGDGLDDLIIGAQSASGSGQGYVVLNTALPAATLIENTVAVATITASDGNNDPLSFAISGGDDSSLFTIDATTGALAFTAAPDFENPGDADGDNVYFVEVEVTDPNGGSDTQLIAVAVTDEAAPIAVNDAVTVDEESVLNGDVFADNGNGADSEPNGAPFTLTAVNGVAADVGTEITLGSGALLTLNSDGTFVYDPNDQFESVAVGETATDSFTYTIDNGNGETDNATVTVTIDGVNDAVVAADDTASTDEDTAFTTGSVFANDNDVDTNDTLTISDVDITGTTGIVTDNGDGTFTYDPNGAFETLSDGDTATDSFTYTVSDGNGSTDTATVTVTINGINDAPVAVDDTDTTDEDTAFTTVNVLTNDSDPEGNTPSVISINTDSTIGTVTDNGDGTFNYDPNAQFEALDAGDTATDSFTYTIDDGDGSTAIATVTLTIDGLPENVAPDAVDDAVTADEETVLSGDVFADNGNGPDSDADGDVFTVIEVNGAAADVGTEITLTSNALLTLNSDGTFNYDPNGQFESLAVGETATDSFTYTIDDGNGATDTATVTVTIDGVNDAPVVTDLAPTTTDEDTAFTTDNVLTNASDIDTSDTLVVSDIDTTATTGAVTDNGDGTFLYDPSGAFDTLSEGDTATDSFTYTISDGNGGTDSATATVTITGVNDAPVAVDDGITTSEEAPVSGAVLPNDSDIEGDALTVTAVNGNAGDIGSTTILPSGALLTLASDGTFDYDPNNAFEMLEDGDVGTDSFTYTIDDGNSGTDTATVTVTINGITDPDNMPPTVVTQDFTLELDAAGNGSIVPADVDGGTTDDVAIASLTVSPNTFDIDDVGTQTVTLVAVDTSFNIASGTAVVTVEDNIAPEVLLQNLVLELDAAGEGNITAADVDDGSSDAAGIASLELSQTDFTVADVGANTITLTVTDNNGNVATADARVTVEDNIAPEVLTQDITVDLDTTGQATITAEDVDDGSNDAASIASLAVDPSSFDGTKLGDNTVTLTVTDANGNVSTDTAIVTVNDPIAPDLTVPADLTIDSIDSTDPSNTGEATATDNADAEVDITFSDTVLANGNIERTFTATDDAGNETTGVQLITVNQAEFTVTIDPASISENGGTATATVTRNTSTEIPQAVTLTSSDTSEATVPATVEIPVGETAVTFAVTAVDDISADGTQTPTITATATGFTDGTTTVDVTDDDTQTSIRVEAEDIANVMGYRLEGKPVASEGEMLSLIGFGRDEVGMASFAFQGVSGFYDVVLGSFDENDGEASLVVEQNGTQIGDTVVLNESLQGGGAGINTKVTRTVGTALELFAGATIKVTGFEEGREHARFDFIEFTPVEPGINMPPVAVDDDVTTDEDTAVTGDILSNDSDPNGDAITVIEVDGNAVDGTPIALASGAQLTITDDGSFTYDPNGAFEDLNTGDTGTDFFEYVITDGNGGFSEGFANITIDGVDEAQLTVTIDADSIDENGGTTTATVSRNTGTTGDLTVTLSSDDTTAGTVDATVTIPDGADAATFTITAVDDAVVDGTQTATITASAAGLLDGSDSVDVTDDEVAALSLSVDLASIDENGGTATATVSRNTGTTGDLTVDLSSSDPTAATVDAIVTIPDGADSVTFTVTAVDDTVADGTQTTDITATATGFEDGTVTVDVIDDEAPTLVVTLAATEIAENGGSTTGTVTRNTGTTGDLVITLTSDDTTEATVDTTVTIPDGANSATFTVTGVDDAVVDGTQTATIKAAGTGFNDGTATVDVTDDDVPTLTLELDAASISENGGTATATVTRNTDTTGDLVITLSSDDPTAATVPATVTIPAGADSIPFPVTGVDDAELDGTQTATVTAAATGFADVTAIVEVTDDEVPEPEGLLLTVNNDVTVNGVEITDQDIALFDAMDYSLFFDGSDVGIPDSTDVNAFDVISPNEILLSFTNPITLDGLAIDDSDIVKFTATSLGDDTAGSFELFFDGSDVGLANNGEDINALTLEADGSLLISVLNNLNPGTGTIATNEDIVRFTPTSTGEDTAGTFVVFFDGSDVGLGETAVNGFSQSPTGELVFSANDDGVVVGGITTENEDVFTFTATATGDDTTGTFGNALFFEGSENGLNFRNVEGIDLTFSPFAAPASLSVSLDPTSISENGGLSTATVTRTGDTSTDLTVTLTSSDTTEATVDATVLIPAGSSTATFDVTAVDDTAIDGAQTVDITAAATDFTSGAATLEVTDDDVPLELTLTLDPTSIAENGGTATATVTRTGDTTDALTVTLTSSDAGEAAVPASITIDAGQATATFVVDAVDDAATDGTQTVDITAAATDFTDGVASLDVIDDDAPAALSITLDPTSVAENGGVATATVTRTGDLSADLTVTLTSSDTSEATVPATVVIAAGQATATVDVTAVDDPDIDGTQTLDITAIAAGLTDGVATLDVTDDDVPADSLLLALNQDITLNGVDITDQDIVQFDGIDFSLYFDASDVGIPDTADVNAFDAISATEILLSFDQELEVPGVGTVDDSDVLLFTATSLGENTAGSFEVYFDGSDVGLASGGEDIDGLVGLPDGSLLLSVNGNLNPGGGVIAANEDITLFTPTSTGDTTAGSFSLFADGSDIVNAADVDGFSINAAGDFHFSFTNATTAGGVTGEDEDVFGFTPASTGDNTSGTFAPELFFDGSQFGVAARDVQGLDLTFTAV